MVIEQPGRSTTKSISSMTPAPIELETAEQEQSPQNEDSLDLI